MKFDFTLLVYLRQRKGTQQNASQADLPHINIHLLAMEAGP